MAFLFSLGRPTGTYSLVQSTKKQLDQCVERGLNHQSPKDDPLPRSLGLIKATIQGSFDEEPKPEKVMDLINSMMEADLLYLLITSMRFLEFESRKDVQTILSYAFRFRPVNSTRDITPALHHTIETRPEIIIELCRGYEHKETASPCGTVLREILKNEPVTAIVLYDESKKGERAIRGDEVDLEVAQSGEGIFWRFFDWIDHSPFEVSTDAFTTFRELLTKHKTVTSKYLQINFDLFFKRYHNVLIRSASYVTMRQSIKLLGELLLDRANYAVMTAYVAEGAHLKISMNLLKDDRKMVKYEGFHVFKVFVANPNKSEAVTKILQQNRTRLLNFLPVFLEDRTDDEQFQDEKAFLIRSINDLPPLGTSSTSQPTPTPTNPS